MLEQQQEKKEELMQKLAHLESIEKQLITEWEEHEAAVTTLKSQMDSEQAHVFQDTKNQVKSSIRNKVTAAVEEKTTPHREVFAKVQEPLKDKRKLLEELAALQLKERELLIKMEDRKVALHKTLQDIDRLSKKQEQLIKECQQLMVELNDCSKMHHLLLAKELDLRQQLSSETERCSQMAAVAPQVEVELQEEMSSRRQLEADVQEAANILRPAVMGSEKVSEAQWKKLREILESSASHGTESALYDSPETSGPGPVRCLETLCPAQSLNLATDLSFLLVRYRPGDCGLVTLLEIQSSHLCSRCSAHLQAAASPQEALLSEGIHDSPDPSHSAPLDTHAEAADC
ncbi:intersectin-1-like [Archocentrus centrarchus]|uniref:intersectin-1-like n=1 Tax=Archocentrus centrarchus TaxID=63155 RepID=UPI0011EA0D4C|nr:intersectin-1-like [Archocentrus centrarchus]